MTTDLLIIGCLLAAVFAARVLLWWKFRNHWRGSRLAISTAQLAVVVAVAASYDWLGARHALAMIAVAVTAILFLASFRIRRDETNVR